MQVGRAQAASYELDDEGRWRGKKREHGLRNEQVRSTWARTLSTRAHKQPVEIHWKTATLPGTSCHGRKKHRPRDSLGKTGVWMGRTAYDSSFSASCGNRIRPRCCKRPSRARWCHFPPLAYRCLSLAASLLLFPWFYRRPRDVGTCLYTPNGGWCPCVVRPQKAHCVMRRRDAPRWEAASSVSMSRLLPKGIAGEHS